MVHTYKSTLYITHTYSLFYHLGIMSNLVLIIISTVSALVSSQDIRGEVTRGLPCIKRLNQLYCHNGGSAYPEDQITVFIDDNKALMRRMYGNLVEPSIDLPEMPKTPASTTFIRRSFPTLRFKRSVLEGYLEDFVDGYEQFELLLQNSTLFAEFNQTAGPEELETFEALKNAKILDRPKRQAGFPGVKPSNDNKVDACESKVEVTTPYWATNSNGKVRAILNDKTFEQAIHAEICVTTRTFRCAGDCACEQKYKWHRLLAYDPNNDCSGIFMDWFLFPSCCSCRCLKNPLFNRATFE